MRTNRTSALAVLATLLIAGAWTAPRAAQAADLNPMVGTWTKRLSGGIQWTLRVLPVNANEGGINGFMCVEYADGSTLAWGFSPQDEPGVVARVKFGVLEVRRDEWTYVSEIPKAGQQRIRHRARWHGAGGAFLKTRLRRTDNATCADRLLSRAEAHFEPAANPDDNPFIGEWSGLWRNGVIDEIQITDIGSWGRTRGVFCEIVDNRTAFRFWDLDDPRIRAHRKRRGDELSVTWKRGPAKWALRHEKKYRFEWYPGGIPGERWIVQTSRYRTQKNELAMTRGSYRARGCLARIRPLADSARSVQAPRPTEDAGRGP